MLEIRTCPSCGSDQIKRLKRDWTDRFGETVYVVPDLQYLECPDCGEKVYDREAMRKIEAYSPAFPGRLPAPPARERGKRLSAAAR